MMSQRMKLEEVAASDEGLAEESITEAFTAGWKAKAKTAAARKARGWSAGKGPGTSSTSKSLAEKKKISTCSSCGQKGHWKGDSQCPNVIAGRDPPHRKPEGGTR